ncbi:MAG: hypothetical protein HIU83_15900 [Proteobacteria bacterium]|nr:hypothetical protein [Pseudomonadota bacterium]
MTEYIYKKDDTFDPLFESHGGPMRKQDITHYLKEVNAELAKRGVVGEMCLYGGAVMCLVFDARPMTRDVDAVFQPANVVRHAAKEVAERYHLPLDWLNDAVKGFVSATGGKKIYKEYSNLMIHYAEPHYLLAMKAMAARTDADTDDIIFLIKELNLKTPQEVFEIIEKYYPRNNIQPKTQMIVEEIFDSIG